MEEAKEQVLALCRRFEVPAILAMGRKGGSNVAAAICNALLYLAGDMLDPAERAGSERKKAEKKALRISLVQGILGAFWDDFWNILYSKARGEVQIYRRLTILSWKMRRKHCAFGELESKRVGIKDREEIGRRGAGKKYDKNILWEEEGERTEGRKMIMWRKESERRKLDS